MQDLSIICYKNSLRTSENPTTFSQFEDKTIGIKNIWFTYVINKLIKAFDIGIIFSTFKKT